MPDTSPPLDRLSEAEAQLEQAKRGFSPLLRRILLLNALPPALLAASLLYLDQYQNLIKETQLIDKKKQYELLNQYRSRDHFLRLVCLISLLWFIYSIINLDFESFSAKSTFDQFLHAIKRLEIFEKTYRMINTEISI